jgi:LPS sulfotransferase NodH
MIVNRRTYNIKPYRMDEAVALMKSEIEATAGFPGAYRIYEAGHLGSGAPYDILVVEFEYENFEAYEKGWNSWVAMPKDEFMSKWIEIANPGGTSEIWRLAASR